MVSTLPSSVPLQGETKEKAPRTINVSSNCRKSSEQNHIDTLPVYDLGSYINGDTSGAVAASMARCLSETGCLVVRDPRVGISDNETFLNLMERYFEQPAEVKLKDARPALHYQVGVTPEGIEKPRCLVDPASLASVRQQPLEHRATLPEGPDAKWRFFWRVGARPQATQYPELNADPIVPEGFANWAEVLSGWGDKMLAALHTTAELLAIGLGLPRNALTNLMDQGPHLLGPTGIDLAQRARTRTSFAGYHYDLNLLTIHGKSRFPGLFIWLADGRRIPVQVPDGCLLLQAGKQLEWLTAGTCKAGMHEVVWSDRTEAAVHAARSEGRSLWRVSSTVFGHVASDQVLQPLAPFAVLPSASQYPPMKAGAYVEQELSVIALKGSQGGDVIV